ncbi:MAG: hypothetical protein PHE46_00015 [Bacteroidales bacterium]|nr:hypothetical protein [Bacteroidales bacterium]
MKRLHIILILLALIPARANAQITIPLVNAELLDVWTGTRKAYNPDTTAAGSQQHHPLYDSKTESWTELGNTGLPAIPNHYQPLTHSLNPIMFNGYSSYNPTPGKLLFLNQNKPFSIVNYNTGGNSDKNGQTINALFGRNLKNAGNLTFLARYVNSDGHFQNQQSVHSIIRVNYRLERPNYHLYLGASRTGFKAGENGGIQNDQELAGMSSAPFLTVNLDKATSTTSIWELTGVQVFDFRYPNPAPLDSLNEELTDTIIPAEKTGNRILHRFSLTSINRHFNDPNPLAAFYPNIFLDSTQTADSVRFSALRNELLFQTDSLRILGLPFRAEVGITPDFFRYAFADTTRIGYNLGVMTNLNWSGPQNQIAVSGRATIVGYAAGDFCFQASYLKHTPDIPQSPVLKTTIEVKGVTPDPLSKHYISNHFQWEQELARQFEAGLALDFDLPRHKLTNRLELFVNHGWIYFGRSGVPKQLDRWNGVVSLSSSKKCRWGPLNLNIRGTAQYSTSKELPLPLFVAGTNVFMHHDIYFKSTGGLLELEYGFDARYTSSFYGYGFMPATGIFFVQDQTKIGNYPYLDAFALIKVKRTRIFVQYCHSLAGMMPEVSFGAVHYPFMRPHLKYGIYWHFYD